MATPQSTTGGDVPIPAAVVERLTRALERIGAPQQPRPQRSTSASSQSGAEEDSRGQSRGGRRRPRNRRGYGHLQDWSRSPAPSQPQESARGRGNSARGWPTSGRATLSSRGRGNSAPGVTRPAQPTPSANEHLAREGMTGRPDLGAPLTAADAAVARGHRPAPATTTAETMGGCATSWLWEEGQGGHIYRVETHIYDLGPPQPDGEFWDRAILYRPCNPEPPPNLVRVLHSPNHQLTGIWGKGPRLYLEQSVRALGREGVVRDWRRLLYFPRGGLAQVDEEKPPEGAIKNMNLERPGERSTVPWRFRFATLVTFSLGLLVWAAALPGVGAARAIAPVRAAGPAIRIGNSTYNASAVLPGHWHLEDGEWGCCYTKHAKPLRPRDSVAHYDHGERACVGVPKAEQHDENCTAEVYPACAASNYTCGPLRRAHRGDRRCGRLICGRGTRIHLPATLTECAFGWQFWKPDVCFNSVNPEDGWTCEGRLAHPGTCCAAPVSRHGKAMCAPLTALWRKATGLATNPMGGFGTFALVFPWVFLYFCVCRRLRARPRAVLFATTAMLEGVRVSAEEASASMCASPGCTTVLAQAVTVTAVYRESKRVDYGCFRPWDLEATGACICDIPTDVSCQGLGDVVPRSCPRIWNGTQRTCHFYAINPYASGGSAQLGTYFAGDGAAYKQYHPTECDVSAAFDHSSGACWGFPTDTVMSVFLVASYVTHPNKTVRVVKHEEVVVKWELLIGSTRCNVSALEPTCNTGMGVVEATLPPQAEDLVEYRFNLSGRSVNRWTVGTPDCSGPDWASPVCARHLPDCQREVGPTPEVPTLKLFDDKEPGWERAPPPGHVWARPVVGRRARACSLDIRVGPYGHASVELPEWLQKHTVPEPTNPSGTILLRLRSPRRVAHPATKGVPKGVQVRGCYECGTPAVIKGLAPASGTCVLTLNGETVAGLPPGPFEVLSLVNSHPPYEASCGGETTRAVAEMVPPAEQSFAGVLYGTHVETVRETAPTWREWARDHWWQLLLGCLGLLGALLVLRCAAQCCYYWRGALAPAK